MLKVDLAENSMAYIFEAQLGKTILAIYLFKCCDRG